MIARKQFTVILGSACIAILFSTQSAWSQGAETKPVEASLKQEGNRSGILEVTTFSIKAGIAPDDFSKRDRSVQRDFTSKQPGFVRRQSGVDEKGNVVVIVYWQSAADADASMKKFMSDASVADYAQMIDGPTMKMARYSVDEPFDADGAGFVEVMSFQVNDGTDMPQFNKINQQVETDFTGKRDGFLQRLTGVDEKGQQIVVVYWRSKSSSDASLQPFMSAPIAKTFMSQMDQKSIAMGRFQLFKIAEHHYFHKKEVPHAAEWSYKGDTGPGHWGDLDASYSLAKTGKQQSPINLTHAVMGKTYPISFDYKPAKIDIVYNGHTIEEMDDNGSTIAIRNQKFSLKQFHFHSPSEHTVDGKHYDMEMHLVHKNAAGRIAVVGLFIKEGTENPNVSTLWDFLPSPKNKERKFETAINVASMLPAKHSYYHYMGSLTTPPCSEQVYWFLLDTPIELSKSQIEEFRAVIYGNNRPTQPLNNRRLIESKR